MRVICFPHEEIVSRLGDVLAGRHELSVLDRSRPIAEQIVGHDVWIFGPDKAPRELLAAAPSLKLLHQVGSGVDGVDRVAAAEFGIAVAAIADVNSNAVAEMCLNLMLTLTRQMRDIPAVLSSGRKNRPIGGEIRGATVAILGLGASGSATAKLCRAMGMQVLGLVREKSERYAGLVDKQFVVAELHEMLGQADFHVVLLSLNESTNKLLDRAAFEAMLPGSYLINLARAQIIDRPALEWALDSEHLGAAALDVFWKEPVDPRDRLVEHPRCTVTPHMAGFTNNSIDGVCRRILDNINALEAGRPLTGVV
jgi:phosphoglycerate dehydrogenase-like enzyme